MRYIATAVVTLGTGAIVGLSEAQAASRKAYLRPVEGSKGKFELTSPIQLKAGEEFDYEGEVPKGMADQVGDAKQVKAAAAKEAAEAAAKSPKMRELQAQLAELKRQNEELVEQLRKASEQLAAAQAALAEAKPNA
jgi:Tfp pilus assembly protein FimV